MYDRQMAAKRSVAKSATKPARVKRAVPVPVVVSARPVPARPLAEAGLKLWDDLHAAGEVRGSSEPLLLLCERFDVRSFLRVRVLRSWDKADLAALISLDDQIDAGLERLGIRTILPSLAEQKADDWTAKLALVEG